MDLNIVIAELRSELETVKQVTSALEKLHEIRARREAEQLLSAMQEEESEVKTRRKRKKSESAGESNTKTKTVSGNS